MKKLLAWVLLLALALTAVPAMAKGDKVKVGLSWVGDVTKGERTKKTKSYAAAVKKAGGEPVLLDGAVDAETAGAILDGVDCIVFLGGPDIGPSWYGESPAPGLEEVNPARDVSDYWLARTAIDRGMPLLAICRGCQLVNVVCGGTLYQDIPSQLGSDLHRDPRKKKYAWHDIAVEDGDSLIAAALGGPGAYEVNSWHHQGIKDVGKGLVVTARSADGLPEALEFKGSNQFMLAVQYHPEKMIEKGRKQQLRLFEMLIEAAKQRR